MNRIGSPFSLSARSRFLLAVADHARMGMGMGMRMEMVLPARERESDDDAINNLGVKY